MEPKDVEFEEIEVDKKIAPEVSHPTSTVEKVFVEKTRLPVGVLRRVLIILAIGCFIGAVAFFAQGYFILSYDQ